MVLLRSNIRRIARLGARRRSLLALLAALAAAVALGTPIASQADLQGTLDAQSLTAQQLKQAIDAQSRKIDATAAGVARAQTRLTALQARTRASEVRLAAVQHRLVAARNRLTRLVNRMHEATIVLAQHLVASYKGDQPGVTTVLLEAHGFADLLDRLDYLQRVGRQDARILQLTRRARSAVLRQTTELQRIEQRDRALTAQVARSRNEAAVVHGALLSRQVAQVAARADTTAKLRKVQGRIAGLRARIARVQREALAAPAPSTTAPDGAAGHLPVSSGGMAQPSSGAPAAVAQVIAAGNAIAGLPYLYGGGHASFQARAYDCSGSVSYALAAAGLLSSPLNSTGFESWGQPGPGKWITVYANAGHAFMVVDGWRFDTVALAQDGTRFTRQMTSTAGFVARHPPGL
jgi:peptidoglycan hydrolase CwlO-like protein